jgi:hypothetical protein
MTPTIILLSVVTWIPQVNKDDDTEKNGFISPDFVKSFISHNFEPVEKILSEKLDDLKGAEARYNKDLTLCRAKVEKFQISETKYESLCDESITTIKKREKQLIDGITKHSQKLQNEIEMERKTVKKTFCDLKRQVDQAEKTIILHQDEIMAALKSIQGSTIFTTATQSKKMMSDLNFNLIPSHGFPGLTRVMTLRRMVLFLLTLSRVLYLNCSSQTEVGHCLMSMSCLRYHKKSALWL